MQPKTKSMTTLINNRVQPSCVLKQAIIMAAGRSNKNKHKLRYYQFCDIMLLIIFGTQLCCS